MRSSANNPGTTGRQAGTPRSRQRQRGRHPTDLLTLIPCAAFLIRLPEGILEDVNPPFLDLLGRTAEGVLGKALPDLVAPPGREPLRDALERLASGDLDLLEQELSLPHPWGHRLYLEVRMAATSPTPHLPEGCVLGLVHNVTEQRLSEAALRTELRFLESIFEHIPVKIFVKDAETLRFLRLNRAAEAILGIPRREMIGKCDHDFFPAEEADAFTAKDREVLTTGKLVDIPEERIHTRDGERILHTQKIPIFDPSGRPLYLLGISEDITERCKAEQALRRSQEMFMATMEGMLDAFMLLSCLRDEAGQVQDFTLLNLNRRAEQLLGVSREDVRNQPLSQVFPVFEEEGLLAAYRDVFDQGMPKEQERWMSDAFPSPGWYYEQIVPWTDGVAVMLRDITERKQTEADLIFYAADLEAKSAAYEEQANQLSLTIHELEEARRQAEEALRQLEDANRKLKESQAQLVQAEKMASLGQLAAGVAHEINNPVGFVTSNLNTLHDYIETYHRLIDLYAELASSLPEPVLPDQRRLLQAIRDLDAEEDLTYIRHDIDMLVAESITGLHRVKEIVQGLKSFARIDEAEMQRADINENIEATLRVIWNELKYHCTVETHLNPLPPIPCYPGKLNQVFMNLLLNAAQAIPDHGVITIETKASDEEIIIRIADTGVGIPPENIPKLFTPFFTTKPVGKGTGLGLSISYGIIQQHHGCIEVESTVGEGTAFTIYLPLSRHASAS